MGYKVSEFHISNNSIDNILPDLKKLDFVFLALHGVFGEDGSIQTILDHNDIAYNGSQSNSSKNCFDKNLTKAIAKNNNILTPHFMLVNKRNFDINDYNLTIKLYENLFSEIHLIDDETNYYYISSLLNHFKTNKIKNEIEKYINLNGGKFSNKLSYEFGKFQFNKNNFKNAIKYLSKIKGDSDEINYMIGISYYNNKSYNKAFEYLKIVKNEKFNDKTNFSLGVISYSLNNF